MTCFGHHSPRPIHHKVFLHPSLFVPLFQPTPPPSSSSSSPSLRTHPRPGKNPKNRHHVNDTKDTAQVSEKEPCGKFGRFDAVGIEFLLELPDEDLQELGYRIEEVPVVKIGKHFRDAAAS
jgi:hypothetical protein